MSLSDTPAVTRVSGASGAAAAVVVRPGGVSLAGPLSPHPLPGPRPVTELGEPACAERAVSSGGHGRGRAPGQVGPAGPSGPRLGRAPRISARCSPTSLWGEDTVPRGRERVSQRWGRWLPSGCRRVASTRPLDRIPLLRVKCDPSPAPVHRAPDGEVAAWQVSKIR